MTTPSGAATAVAHMYEDTGSRKHAKGQSSAGSDIAQQRGNMRHVAQLGISAFALLASACGGGAASEPDGSPDGGLPVEAGSDSGAPGDADRDADPPDDSGPADPDAGPPRPWDVVPTVVGTAQAVSPGIAGPLFPFAVLPFDDRVFIVGEARADLRWGTEVFPSGGYLLAVDAATGALLFHRALGDAVYGIARYGSDVVIAGAFIHPMTLARASGGPIELVSLGATDGFVARMSRDGDVQWATSFGSGGFDHAFDVHTSGERILIAGALRGDWVGCGGTLRPHPGVVDPFEGRVIGAQDALLVELDPSGACVDASVIGHAGTDEFALHVLATDGAVFVSGEGGGPLVRRSVSGDEHLIGEQAGGWLVRVGEDGTHDVWSVGSAATRGSRGRGLGVGGDQLYFSFTSEGGNLLHGDEVVGTVERGVGVMRLSLTDGAITHWALGRGTLDTIDLAISNGGIVIPATGADPSHIQVALLEGEILRSFRNDVIASYPYVVAADGGTVWMAGSAGADSIVLGVDEVEVSLGPQGGLFLVRLDL